MLNLFDLLAQTTPTTPPAGGPNAAPTPGAGAMLLPAMMIALVVFMLLSARSTRKREERQRQELHNNLSKNQRVLTIGGVVGTVVSVKDDMVVLKVDESTNTKMTFLKSAIQRIMSDDASVGGEVRGI